ncbi:MAG: hypothetical protein ABIJ00_08535 [Candidatus Eisenbacteria bacterium]
MRTLRMITLWVVLICVPVGTILAQRAFQLKEDYELDPLSDCALQYYYYIPCPTYSWFWSYYYWDIGDVAGSWFDIGDLSTGGFGACDPTDCHTLDQIRILNSGVVCQGPFGQSYPGAYVHFEVHCADEIGRPVGPTLWRSNTMLLDTYGWNYIDVDPPISICGCAIDPGPPASTPRILVTIAVHPGTAPWCMELGADNISDAIGEGCDMHDDGCLPALYPRPHVGYYPTMHSAFYRQMGTVYDPPKLIRDRNDTTPDRTQYGYVELAWRIYLTCSGPSERYSTTWGGVKSLYR